MAKDSRIGVTGGGSGIGRSVIKTSPSLSARKNPGYEVSDNVRVIPSKTNNTGRMRISSGAQQAARQNAGIKTNVKPVSAKAEAKANARGLKAANKPASKSPSKLSQAIAKKMYPKGVPSTKKSK